MAEPLAILAVAATLFVTDPRTVRFWLLAAALAALVLVQAVFWLRVQPVNRQWLGSIKLSGAAEHFFQTGETPAASQDWTKLRDRWENGHVIRALASLAAFVLLLLAMA